METKKRAAGEPVPTQLRKKIIKELRDGGSVGRVARRNGVTWNTADKIREEAGIERRKSGLNDSDHATQAAKKAILEDLRRVPRESDDVIALRHGLSKSTVRNMRVQAGIAATAKTGRLDSSEESKIRIGMADEINRLKAELKKLQREAIDEEAIRILLGIFREHRPEPPNWLITPTKKNRDKTAEVPMTIWSDWHMGEKVDIDETERVNEFNPQIAEQRIRRLVESIIHLADHYGPGVYPGIVINLLGDFVSGALHPELAKTDSEEVIPSAIRCFDILVWALDRMAERFGSLYVPCAAGNHGRNTVKPEYKRYVYKNFDWLIFQLLDRHYAKRKNVVIDVRAANQVHYRVFGMRFLALHGDMLGVKGGDGIIGSLGPIMRGEIKTRGQSATIGKDYDVLLMGHWHQMLWLPRAIVANCLIGFNEYGRLALRAPPTPPSQPLWFVHPRRGITSRWDVQVGEPPALSDQPWVSMQRSAA